MSEPSTTARSRRPNKLRSCDTCRIARQACNRRNPGEPCERCQHFRIPELCSPGRTVEQFREMLYGEYGLLKYRIFHDGGFRNLTEASQENIKNALKVIWQLISPHYGDTSLEADIHGTFSATGSGVSATGSSESLPDVPSDADHFPALPLLAASSASTWPHSADSPDVGNVAPEEDTPMRDSVATPYPDNQRSSSNFSSYASSASTLAPTHYHAESNAPLAGLSNLDSSSTSFENEGTFRNQTTISSGSEAVDPLELLAKLDRLKQGYVHIQTYTKLLHDERLGETMGCQLLNLIEQNYVQQITSLINQIKTTLSNPSFSNEGLLYGFYETLVNDIEGYGLPEDQQITILTDAFHYYQQHGFNSKAESVCHRLKTLDEYQIIATELMQNTCNDVAASHEAVRSPGCPPGLFRPTVLPFLHRALEFPTLFLSILQAQRAEPYSLDMIGQNIIHKAAQSGDAKLLKLSLQFFPALIEERDIFGRTPLFIATTANNVEASKILLDNGADPEARDSSIGRTMMEICAGLGYLPAVQLLANRGASVHPDLVLTSTPLQAAAEAGHAEIVDFLLHTGKCKKDFVRPGDQKNAREIALSNNHSGIAQLLA